MEIWIKDFIFWQLFNLQLCLHLLEEFKAVELIFGRVFSGPWQFWPEVSALWRCPDEVGSFATLEY